MLEDGALGIWDSLAISEYVACHKVDIDAESWRDLHAFERDDSPDTTTPHQTKTKKR